MRTRTREIPRIDHRRGDGSMTPELRILTVRQPWAWAIIHAGKDVENRVRNIAGAFRGSVAIHAGLALDESALIHPAMVEVLNPLLNAIPPKPRSWWANRGSIIGVVDLVDVHPPASLTIAACSPWAEKGAHHLVLANPRPLAEPIPYRGALGLRKLPEDVASAVWAGVAA